MKQQFLIAALLLLGNYSYTQPTLGLVAYWNMDGNFADNGPFNITGTNNGATATTNNKNVANTAMNFANPASPVVQFATHPINSNLNFGVNQDFTIDFSVFTSSQPHPGGIYDNNLNYGGPGIFMWNANGFQQLVFNCKNASALTTNGALPLNVWKHVACVRAGAVTRIYINGVLNVTAAPGTLAPVYNFPARFGSMFYNGFSPPQYNGHNGKIDEFRIYNRALSASEILGLSAIALPVKLSSFTASNNNNRISLNWQTQYEQNSSHFNVQRSTDGINYSTVSRVTAIGNAQTISNYSSNDILDAGLKMQPTIFYRLESVDMDGNFSFSQVIAIHPDKNGIQLMVSPNPAKNILQVQTGNNVTGTATLLITNSAGNIVFKKELKLLPGSNNETVNISMLSNGMYYVTLNNGATSFLKQFIKED